MQSIHFKTHRATAGEQTLHYLASELIFIVQHVKIISALHYCLLLSVAFNIWGDSAISQPAHHLKLYVLKSYSLSVLN